MEFFTSGIYKIEWVNKQGETIKTEEKFLNWKQYRHEIMDIQTAFLQGVNVYGLRVIPIKK
jgi:hypothetical protein